MFPSVLVPDRALDLNQASAVTFFSFLVADRWCVPLPCASGYAVQFSPNCLAVS